MRIKDVHRKMKINISYYLDENGWSSCWIQSNNRLYDLSITHIYPEDPIEECLNALIGMMNGETERKFNWYAEPGGRQIIIREIPAQKHKVQFKVISFSKKYTEQLNNIENSAESIEHDFSIKKIQLVRMLFYEFKKISELMKDKEFESNRKNYFPFRKFREFEKIALDYIDWRS